MRESRTIRVGVWLIFATVAMVTLVSGAQDPCLILASPSLSGNEVHFTLIGESGIAYVVESSSDLAIWNPTLTNSDVGITRHISVAASADQTFFRVVRGLLPVFDAALAAEQSVDLTGISVDVDSYDSSDELYCTAGYYDYAKRKAGGDLAAKSGLANVGNADVKGKVRTGPAGNIWLLPNGSVGDLSWNGPGIQIGWYVNDYNACFPSVAVPFTDGIPPSGSGTNLYVLGTTNYLLSGHLNISNSQSILVLGDAALFVTGNVNMQGASAIDISTGASLRIYVAGASAALTHVNTSNSVSSFQYFGLPGNSNVAWPGPGQFTGTIYAPAAAVALGGGVAGTRHFQGACVARTVTLYDHVKFHFDENLRRTGPFR